MCIMKSIGVSGLQIVVMDQLFDEDRLEVVKLIEWERMDEPA